MKALVKWGALAVCAFCLLVGPSLIAADAQELVAAFESIYRPELDTSTTLDVAGLELAHKDLNLTFNSGRLAFFKPVIIDSAEVVYGAFFAGYGSFRYAPPVGIEKEQLTRFMNSDSLNRTFENMVLFFSSEIYGQIASSGQPAAELFGRQEAGKLQEITDFITENENREYAFKALRGIAMPVQRPYLHACSELDKGGTVYYLFDPHEREEVALLKHDWQEALSIMETACRYSQYIDEAYVNVNGLCKDCIEVYRYNIEAAIEPGGDFDAVAAATLEVKVGPTQLVNMYLHPELKIDSVVDESGRQVAFIRYEKHKSEPLYLVLDRSLTAGDVVTLNFFYGGDMVDHGLVEFFVDAGATWYPRYSQHQRALFNLKFKTQKQFSFAASGNLIGEEVDGDYLTTTWRVVPPVSNVSFTIGNLKKSTFEEKDVAPVDVYFSKKLHDNMWATAAGEGLAGKNMEKQVSDDVINALRLFSHHFGPYPYERMTVSEVFHERTETFPSFLPLGFNTWHNTDTEGYDRLARAREVAHQWWGVGVGYETYHDQWLSEGLAEYSALIYLQAVAGNEQFVDRLRDYRNEIFTVRKYLLGSGEEAGPIALGRRTSSTKTAGDDDLIIYKKGAFIVHMLRNMMIDLRNWNEDPFYNMLKEWYGANRGANMRTSDFKRLVEKHTQLDMTWFFNQWIYSNDLPTCRFSYNVEPDTAGGYLARCRVVTTGVPEDFVMYMPMEIEIDNDNKAYIRVLIDSLDYEFTLPQLPSQPKKLRLNPFESVLAKIEQ